MAGKAVVRIYSVKSKSGTLRLVRAKSAAQALNHVVDDTFEVKVASQDDLVTGLQGQVKIEVAEQPLVDPNQQDLPIPETSGEPAAEPIVNGNGEDADPNAELPL